jgi:plastocyanin
VVNRCRFLKETVMFWSRSARFFAIVVFGATVLAACGGNDEEKPTPTAVPPTSVGQPTPPLSATEGTAPMSAATPVPASPIASPVRSATPTATAATPLAASSPAGSSSATPESPAASPSVGTKVSIILTDYRIGVFATDFVAGQPYTFVIENNGTQPHQFVIEVSGASGQPLTDGDRRAIVESIAPGDRATLTWTFAEPGIYQFACHMPGHFERGMVQSSIAVTE